jgi:hypothetical protein
MDAIFRQKGRADGDGRGKIGRMDAFERLHPSLLSGQAVGTLERLAISGWRAANCDGRLAISGWEKVVVDKTFIPRLKLRGV